MKPSQLPAFDKNGVLNVIIETPRGSRNKYAFEAAPGLYALRKVLPLGMSFPFDFGFIPSTKGGDGDPLDVLVLMDEAAFPGCWIKCHLLGVIEAEQREGKKKERNDRLIARALAGQRDRGPQELKDLPPAMLAEIEAFFANYNQIDGKEFRILRRGTSERAQQLVKRALP
jgi:inorganic pyrophosphatase